MNYFLLVEQLLFQLLYASCEMNYYSVLAKPDIYSMLQNSLKILQDFGSKCIAFKAYI